MAFKFTTMEAPQSTATKRVYIGIPQHERILSKKETYEYLAEQTGFKASAIAAAFLALAKFVTTESDRALITQLEEIASFRNSCRGSFASSSGPWVKGKNMIVINGVTIDTFRSTLSGIVPTNNTEGASPIINSVYDETTKAYDIITGTDTISIAGADLAVDTTATDEGVFLRSESGTETRMTVTHSDIQVVKANLAAALAAGEYTLVVRTRSGMGEEYGVAEATRKVTVLAVA